MAEEEEVKKLPTYNKNSNITLAWNHTWKRYMILILGNVFLHFVSALIIFALNEEGIKVKGSRKDCERNAMKSIESCS